MAYARPCGDFKTSYAQDMALLDIRLYRVGFVLLAAGLVAAPWLLGRWIFLLNDIAIFAIAATGLSVLMGFAGQISLGHAAFMAVGAYSSWFVTAQLGWPFVAALPLAGLSAFAVGAVVGLPSLRIKGLYLAIATLAFQFLVEYVIVQTVSGMGGTPVPPLEIFGRTLATETQFYYLVLPIWVGGAVFATNLVRTRVGLALMAVRDRDYAAQVLGVNLLYYKTLAFAISAFYAGVAGSLFAHYNRVIGAEHFSLAQSIDFVAMLVIGGLGSVWGPHLGAAFVRTLTQILKIAAPLIALYVPLLGRAAPSLREILFGALLIGLLIWEPGGLA
ncbi:MAG: branched-chain amino acid ABC transporter permease, partial [Armatimonadota bacterium]|nr:branched-chain amino acid ABC transporter permease [Armatimonadota bacterium]